MFKSEPIDVDTICENLRPNNNFFQVKIVTNLILHSKTLQVFYFLYSIEFKSKT